MKDKLLPKSHFPLIVGITAMVIAVCAAGFSVYGIAMLFSGAILSVAVMAATLEIGKIVATTYLYRYWNEMGKALKSYLTLSVITLMVITSLGIFGFLSSAYQKSSLEFELTQGRIQAVESQKESHDQTIESLNARITVLNQIRTMQEQRLSDAQTNVFLSRNPIQLSQLQSQTSEMIQQANGEIKEKNQAIDQEKKSIIDINRQIAELKIGAVGKKDIQTMKYLADQLNWELDRVAFWFMLSIIFVFDPLAIALILAYNVAIFHKQPTGSSDNVEDISQPIPTEEVVPPTGVSVAKQLILDADSKKA